MSEDAKSTLTMPMSYTSAGQWPWKLLQRGDWAIAPDGKIRPVHIQLIPTNNCNGNCSWCSCAKVDRTKELSLAEIKAILKFFSERGTRGVTITGGGEPTLHPDLRHICEVCHELGIKIGLVTNGKKWGQEGVDPIFNKYLTWVRVSTVETHEISNQLDHLERIASDLYDVDLGASFTVSSAASIDLGRRICETAEILDNITHIRFVQNILDPDHDAMAAFETAVSGVTTKSIFQYREIFDVGSPKCFISLLKPVISAEGLVYPCCSVQYSGTKDEERDMPDRFVMGKWSDYDQMKPFDGSICAKCYYTNYNLALEGLTTSLAHREFL